MGREMRCVRYSPVDEGWADPSRVQAQPDNYSKLRERQLFYVVSVPGESAWVKEARSSHLAHQISRR